MRSVPTDDRSTDRPLNFENLKCPYLWKGSSGSLHVWFYVGFSRSADRMALFPCSWTKFKRFVGENSARGVIRLITI